MTKIEKVFEDTKTMKKLLDGVLIKGFCPAFFGLKNSCDIARDCEKCWNEEVGE